MKVRIYCNSCDERVKGNMEVEEIIFTPNGGLIIDDEPLGSCLKCGSDDVSAIFSQGVLTHPELKVA